MQPVNDDMDNMDNLFRQAANNYPLNTSGANFDNVRLQEDVETSMPKEKEPKRRYLWLLLLLLVPFPFLLRHYQINPIPQYGQNNQQHQAAPQNNKNHLSVKTTIDTNTTGKQAFATRESKKNEGVNNTDSLTTQHPATVDVKTQPGNRIVANHSTNSNIKQQFNKVKSQVSTNRMERQLSAVISKKTKRQRSTNASVFLQSGTKNSNRYPLSSGHKIIPEKVISRLDTSTIKQTVIRTGSAVTDSTKQTIASKQSTDTSTSSKKSKANDNTNTAAVKKPVINNKNQSKPGVYIGLITGPDFSAVKSNRVDGAGYNIGFLAGYYTGRHLTFETGLIWNYKRYYSKGTHVSTENLGLPMHTEILDLNGSCNLVEIPMTIQYHFNSHTNGNLYLGAGVSSYIMKKEDYSYESKRYNMQYYGYKNYTNSSKNWLSVLQLHVGYQISLKHAGSLRIEPYAKLPLQGIGIGKLPLSSAGVNFGFTLPIH